MGKSMIGGSLRSSVGAVAEWSESDSVSSSSLRWRVSERVVERLRFRREAPMWAKRGSGRRSLSIKGAEDRVEGLGWVASYTDDWMDGIVGEDGG